MEEFSDVQIKQRAVIEFLTAEKVPPIEIHRRMQAVYGDQCVDVSTVRCCVRRFKDGELLCIRTVCLCMTTLTEVFPCFFLSCKANAGVNPAKTGHSPHSS